MGRDDVTVSGTCDGTDWDLDPPTKPDVRLSMAEVAALYAAQWREQREALDKEQS